MRTVKGLLALLFGIGTAAVIPTASASPPPGGETVIVCTPSGCKTVVTGGGHSGGGGGHSGGGAGGPGCTWEGQQVPCSDPQMGVFEASDGCYIKEANPYPTSGPVYVSWKTGGGAIYWETCPFTGGSGGYIWLPTPPAGLPPSPGELAKRAAATFKFPKPSGHRSPSENKRYDGYPFSYVNLWLFDWTDPGTWKTLTASASAGGNWARVTATPVALTFDPGDGSPAVSCDGPGRPWTASDGYGAPSDGACGYMYKRTTMSPITATQSITWKISWVGSGGTSGTLPDRSTSTSGQLQIFQVQVVNR